MGETPFLKNNKTATLSRLQSPFTPFFLGSNDDALERAQARAARVAASRRKSIVPPTALPTVDPCFSKHQIMEIFQNCIKLASENKINQKNTWELTLIDHISEIIQTEGEDDVETNFQMASCTLEAGVKIYSLRVDSVHSEAYKVLGAINRAGRADEDESIAVGDHIEGELQDGCRKVEKKRSPLSTLESSFEALNVKKFDVAFAVDPLYHQTSAQFDEGGAKGLLLNNLGVYGGCRVVFDSLEVPGKFTACPIESNKSELIDISFVRDCIEQMMAKILVTTDISPTLSAIFNQFDEDNRRPPNVFSVGHKSAGQTNIADDNQDDLASDAFEGGGEWKFDHDDRSVIVDETSETVYPTHQEENDPYTFDEPGIAERYENVADFLVLGLGFTSNRNAWAGPDHWKFRKVKGVEDIPAAVDGSPITNKKLMSRKQAESDIDFTKCLDKDMSDIFAPPKNPKLLLLPANRVPCKATLPEDCHYQPEDLVKLFLLPNVMFIGKRARKISDESDGGHDFGAFPEWDNDNFYGGQSDDVEDSSTLVSQPRQVNKIEVQYDRTSKQVDVHGLKGTLWTHMQESLKISESRREGAVSFTYLLSTFPDDCQAAAREDISIHLCFICLLHLANEHGLSIVGCPNLDDLQVHFPVPT